MIMAKTFCVLILFVYGNWNSGVISKLAVNYVNNTNFPDVQTLQMKMIKDMENKATTMYDKARSLLKQHGYNVTDTQVVDAAGGRQIVQQLKELARTLNMTYYDDSAALKYSNSTTITNFVSIGVTYTTGVPSSTTPQQTVDVFKVYPLRERWNIPYPVDLYRFIIQPLVDSMGISAYPNIKHEVHEQLCKFIETNQGTSRQKGSITELVNSLEKILGVNPSLPPKFDKKGDSHGLSKAGKTENEEYEINYSKALSKSNILLTEYRATACYELKISENVVVCANKMRQKYSLIQLVIIVLNEELVRYATNTCQTISHCDGSPLQISLMSVVCPQIDASKTTLRTKNFVSNHLLNSSLFSATGGAKNLAPSLSEEAASLKRKYVDNYSIYQNVVWERNNILLDLDRKVDNHHSNCEEMLNDILDSEAKAIKNIALTKRQLLVVSGFSELDILDAYLIEMEHNCEQWEANNQKIALLLNN